MEQTSEYSCMPSPQTPVVTYIPEQNSQETQISSETSECETQTRCINTESQNVQVGVDTSEMTTQTKVLGQNETTTQTKVRTLAETMTQTKVRVHAEMTTQTKANSQTEMTTQTKVLDLNEVTTQTKVVSPDTSETTTQTKALPLTDGITQTSVKVDHDEENESDIPISDVKIVFEMHADDLQENEDNFEESQAQIIDDNNSDICCKDFPAPDELCACAEMSGAEMSDSKVDENECSFSCSSECSSCSCLDPSNNIESQNSPAVFAQSVDIFDNDFPGNGASFNEEDLPQVCNDLLEAADEKDDTEPTIIAPPITFPEEIIEAPPVAEVAPPVAEVAPPVADAPPPVAEVVPVKDSKRSESRSRSKSHHGEKAEKNSSSASAAVQFEITARGVRVISEKESFL